MKRVRVHDSMQKGYTYERTEPTGKNFDPDFKPELTPKQMLALGVFGGKYLADCRKEFPTDWFARAKMVPKERNNTLNYFKVSASLPLSEWKKRGWLHKNDPRGWFQWYCRYYMGRRMPKEDQLLFFFANKTMASNPPAHRSTTKKLQKRRPLPVAPNSAKLSSTGHTTAEKCRARVRGIIKHQLRMSVAHTTYK